MKDINYYLKLPYTISFHPDEDGAIVARVDELPGCEADGPTVPEALENLDELKRAWIEDAIESGQQVPEPKSEEELPSGKWVQRVPRSLHLKLSRVAKREGVSLNSLVTSILSEALGTKALQPPQVTLEQSVAAPATTTELADVWHQAYANWGQEPAFLTSNVAIHSGRGIEPQLSLADTLKVIISSLPKDRRQISAKGITDAEKKSQKLGRAC